MGPQTRGGGSAHLEVHVVMLLLCHCNGIGWDGGVMDGEWLRPQPGWSRTTVSPILQDTHWRSLTSCVDDGVPAKLRGSSERSEEGVWRPFCGTPGLFGEVLLEDEGWYWDSRSAHAGLDLHGEWSGLGHLHPLLNPVIERASHTTCMCYTTH